MSLSVSVARLFTIIALPLFILSACTGGTYTQSKPTPTTGEITTPPARTQTVNVGFLVPLTGPSADIGEALLQAGQLALSDIGYTNINLIPRDTAGTPEGAAAAAQDVVNQGAELLIGPLFASEARAAKQIAGQAGVPIITFSTDFTLAGNGTYVMGILPFSQVNRVLEYAGDRGVKNVTGIFPRSPYGKLVSDAYGASVSTARLNNVGVVNTDTNFPALNQNVASLRVQLQQRGIMPQAVFLPMGGNEARAAAQVLAANGFSGTRILGTGLMDDPALATEPGLQGVWFAAPSPSGRARFESSYAALYGKTAPRISTLAYDAVSLASVLARNSQGQSPYSRENINNPNGFSGLDGIFRFRPNGLVERGLAVLTYRNGEIVEVGSAPRSFQ